MKKRLFLICALYFAALSLFAFGRREEPAREPVNREFVLCITAFDVSALPAARKVMGDTITRSIAADLVNMEFRFRTDEESDYYRNYAWTRSMAEAARALSAKRSERDILLFRGDPSWRYRKNLKALDEAILDLEKDLAEITAFAPLVEEKPELRLTGENINEIYPAPPKHGEEYRFCTEQGADAFIAGSLSEYHGRIYLEVKMYTRYTRSYSFEESVLFSFEDISGALNEISGRLAAAVSGTFPAAILVNASPDDTMVILDGSFAGQGDVEITTHSLGMVEVELRADNYIPVYFPLNLNAGELSEITINLTPMHLNSLEVDAPGNPGSRVYLASLFVGEAPLTLQLPRTHFSYISVETPTEQIASAIYRDNDIARGSAQFIRHDAAFGTANFNPRVPISPEDNRVDRARRAFYGAYGAFWFILPASLITAGIAGTYIDANNISMAMGTHAGDPDKRKRVYDNAAIAQNVRIGAYCVMGAALGVTLFFLFRYIYISTTDATPIVRARTEQ